MHSLRTGMSHYVAMSPGAGQPLDLQGLVVYATMKRELVEWPVIAAYLNLLRRRNITPVSREGCVNPIASATIGRTTRRAILAGMTILGLAAGFAATAQSAAAASRFVFANESDYDTMDPRRFDVGWVSPPNISMA
jgi:hypothetical protein